MQQTKWTDQQIKAAIRHGGRYREQAVEYIFKSWYRYLVSAAQKTGLAPEEIEEVINETIWQLTARMINPKFEEIEHLQTYAYRMVFNKAYTQNKNRKETVEIDAAHFLHADQSERSGKLFALQETENELEKMGDPCRTILLMKAKGYQVEDIAAETGLAVSTVRNKTGPCREELIRRLGEKPY